MKSLIFTFFFTITLFGNSLEDIHSFQASFTQSIINSSQKEILYTGDLLIKKPLRMVWRYNEPTKKFVYIKENMVTIIEPELEQAIFSEIDKEFNILEILKNGKKISPTTYLATFNNTQYTLTVTDGTLKKIEYKDTIDNSVTISFSNIKQNHPIDETLFRFTIPYEYDIIRK